MLNGIGSMPEIIAANVAWIWSVLKLNKNMNGLKQKWEVRSSISRKKTYNAGIPSKL